MRKLNPSVLCLSHPLSSSSKTLSVPCFLLARNQTLLNKNKTIKQRWVNLISRKIILRVTLGFKSEMYILSLLGNPNLCSPTLKPLHPCLKPKQPLSHVVLVMLAVWIVILLVSLVLWFYKTKFLAFGTKSKKKWKVIAFHWMGFNEEDIFAFQRKENLIGWLGI